MPALSMMSSSFRASSTGSRLYELVQDSITIQIYTEIYTGMYSSTTFIMYYIAMPRKVFSGSDRALVLLSLFIGSEIHALARSWQIGFSIRRALRVPTEHNHRARKASSESKKCQIISALEIYIRTSSDIIGHTLHCCFLKLGRPKTIDFPMKEYER